MSDVVDLNSRRPHLEGAAKCVECQHVWQAVAPTGTWQLECPACGLLKGVWKFITVPGRDIEIYVCECGNDMYFLRKDGAHCLKCAKVHAYADLQ